MFDKAKIFWNNNVSPVTVYSTVAGLGLFGLIIFVLDKSGVKVVRKMTKIFRGGK